MPDRILETKFHTPIWRSDGVMRPRLLDQLQAGLQEQRKLTLVAAPAGYGKTSLITSWLNSLKESTPHIWLSLEKNDNDPARFLSYWATAYNRISDFELENILELLDTPQLPPYQSILDDVINALARLEESAVLVLDDYHVITNSLIHEMLEYFLEHQPHQAHLVIITRSDPPLPLARLRARGQMVEIRASDLRFTEKEVSQFFNQSMQLMLEEEDIHSLEMRRWVGRACWDLGNRLPEDWLWILDRIKVIMEDLPPDGGQLLLDLYKQLPGHLKIGQERTSLDELRHLLIRLSENWERYTTFFHDPGLPWTNNRTEQAIGRMKMRARTVRGYKTEQGMLNGLLVSSVNLT